MWTGRLAPIGEPLMRHLLVGVGALVFLTGCGHQAIRYTWTGDCARTYPVFNDGFEVPILPKWSAKTP